MQNEVLELFWGYMGTGLIVIWFLVSLIYLWVLEKRKHIRIIFVYVPIVLLLVFFNPLFARIVSGVAGGEIYYRFLWLIPMTMVIAYSVTDAIGRMTGAKKVFFVAVSVVAIMVSGRYIYSNPYFKKAENIYHMPQSVVDICDAIEVEGREVSAIFPLEMLQYVRQYSAVICMPYGRDMLVEAWQSWGDEYAGSAWYALYDLMEVKEIEAKQLAEGCRAQGVVYIILPADKKVNGSFADYEFEEFAVIGEYVVYKDATVDLTVILE